MFIASKSETKEQIENANYVYEQIKKYIDKQAEWSGGLITTKKSNDTDVLFGFFCCWKIQRISFLDTFKLFFIS